jgi:tubulin polyglutamylase TTLL1
VNRLSQLKKWAKEANLLTSGRSYVVSRYLDAPLLIGGKKFDLRMYVLVTSYRPLRCYISRLGFARFCSVKYDANITDMDNMFVHLTNVSLQKFSSTYNDVHGGKWTVENLKLLLEGTRGKEATDKLFDDIGWIMVQSLKSVQNVIVNDRHCFEIYGYDVIIDSNLKPWLIEINASPSMTSTTVSDRILKSTMIDDAFRIIFPDGEMPDVKSRRNPTHDEMGTFELLYDEAATAETIEKQKKASLTRKPSSLWK